MSKRWVDAWLLCVEEQAHEPLTPHAECWKTNPAHALSQARQPSSKGQTPPCCAPQVAAVHRSKQGGPININHLWAIAIAISKSNGSQEEDDAFRTRLEGPQIARR